MEASTLIAIVQYKLWTDRIDHARIELEECVP